MAYAEQVSSRRRATTLGVVVGLHALVGAAVLSAFAGGIVETYVPFRLPTQQWDASKPPPPEPTPSASAKPRDPIRELPEAHPLVLPKPFDFTETIVTLPADPGVGKGLGTGDLVIVPSPTPSDPGRAKVPAIGVRPLGNPALWATTDDYPGAALREGRQGVTWFELSVGSDGKVSDCRVTQTSGSPELDAATCRNVMRRARFKLATNEFGDAAPGIYRNAIHWVIPKD